jgi:hypothetical protein
MDRRELQKRLEQLDGELGQIAATDARERAILQQARADLRELLSRTDEIDSEHYARITERLRERVAELEATYPRATIVLGRIVDTLANLGL